MLILTTLIGDLRHATVCMRHSALRSEAYCSIQSPEPTLTAWTEGNPDAACIRERFTACPDSRTKIWELKCGPIRASVTMLVQEQHDA
jgi:hypothetical protein